MPSRCLVLLFVASLVEGQVSPRIVLATVPSSGTTWLRQVVEIARGIASETVYEGKQANAHGRRYNEATFSWGHPCGIMTRSSNGFQHDYGESPKPMHARFGICPLMRLANSTENILIKTHFPAISSGPEELQRGNSPGQLGGVILTRRDVADNYKACLRRGFTSDTMEEFAQSVKAHHTYWQRVTEQASVPMVTVDWEDLRSSNLNMSAFLLDKLRDAFFPDITEERVNLALALYPARGHPTITAGPAEASSHVERYSADYSIQASAPASALETVQVSAAASSVKTVRCVHLSCYDRLRANEQALL